MRLGTAHLTALELPPLDFVRQAARAGFGAVGLRLRPAMPGGVAYPLRAGTTELAEVRDALRQEGVAVRDVEFVEITPDLDVAGLAPMLEAASELGAGSITVTGDDPDGGRLTANFAALCDLAAGFALRVEIEFMRWRATGTLAAALTVTERAARPNGGVLVDALHLIRSGGDAAAVAAAPAMRLRSLQLSDVPLAPPEDIVAEARAARLPPGQGGLPLTAILRAMPAGTAVSAEVPMAEVPPAERLSLAFEATRVVVQAAKAV